jgi:dTDP-4-amino-4,6-dideoxygalactose transaminase
MYKGKSVGSIGDIGAWSFCQDKIMTTGGEGGMVTTNNKVLWEKMWSHKDHGKNYSKVYSGTSGSDFRWLHDDFGSNYRMMEIQGAIGRIQLKKMKKWTLKRNENAMKINSVADQHDIVSAINVPAYSTHAFYKCYLRVESDRLNKNWSRRKIVEEINKREVPCYEGICSEIYKEKAFESLGEEFGECQNASLLGRSSFMFLVHPTLTKKEIEKTCFVLNEILTLAK